MCFFLPPALNCLCKHPNDITSLHYSYNYVLYTSVLPTLVGNNHFSDELTTSQIIQI